MKNPITLALPKGRLQELIQELLSKQGIPIVFKERILAAEDDNKRIRAFLVKNSDLPVYVNHGIAGLGICGEDVIYESGYTFYNLHTFSFGTTKMCLAGFPSEDTPENKKKMIIATKFSRFTRDFYHARGIPVQIIKLNGSVELAPLLGLAPYIVDLVETGGTLKAHKLEILSVLKEIRVSLIANPGYYKRHYKEINELVELLRKGEKP